jgi:hypothetical protein
MARRHSSGGGIGSDAGHPVPGVVGQLFTVFGWAEELALVGRLSFPTVANYGDVWFAATPSRFQ